jgi:hypothetical protein
VNIDGTPAWAYDDLSRCVCCRRQFGRWHTTTCKLREALDALLDRDRTA